MTTKCTIGSNRNNLMGIAAILLASSVLQIRPTIAAETAGKDASSLALEEVVVTARRREENLQTVPVAVTVLSGDALIQKGVQNVMDLQKFVPSLRVVSADVNPKIFFVSIRGFRGQSPNLTEDPAIGTYFAESVIAHPLGFGDEMYDIQSVQVLKGPQGTLFGRNTIGGAVLIEPVKPSVTDGVSGSARLTVGEYNLRKFTAAVNLPFGSVAALRVAGEVHKRDGYTTNVLSGLKYDEVDNSAARISLLLEPTENISSNTIVNYLDEDSTPASTAIAKVIPAATIGTFGAALGGTLAARFQQLLAQQQSLGSLHMISAVGSNVIAPFSAGLAGPGIDSFSPARCTPGAVFLCRNGTVPRETLKVYGVLNNTSVELGAVTLKNIASYRKMEHEINGYDLVPGGFLTPGLQAFQINDAESASDELQISGKAFNDRLDWIGGAFWFKEQGVDDSPSYQFRNDLFSHNKSKNINETKAVFAQGDYKFTDQWKLTLGVRETWDQKEGHNLNTDQSLVAGVPTELCSARDETGARLTVCDYSATRSWSAFTWNASVQYQLQPDMMLYGSVRRGYKSGGFSRIINIPQRYIFNPEYVLDVELGLKADLDLFGMPLRTNVAVFYDKYEDQQVQVSQVVAGSFRNFTDNAGKSHVQGGELELTLLPVNNLEITAFASYLDAAYDEYVSKANLAGSPDIDLSAIPFGQNYAIPKWQGGLSVQYQVPLDKLGTLRFSADGAFRSRSPTNNDALLAAFTPQGYSFTPQIEEPGRSVFNARIDWDRLMGGPVDVGVYATNLTDKVYIEGGAFVIGVETVHYAQPRMIGVEFAYKFGEKQ